MQHRANRGMGGAPDLDRPSNLIILCSWFNGLIERNVEAARYARAMGWKLRSWDDPLAVPYFDALAGAWWLPDDDGGRERVG